MYMNQCFLQDLLQLARNKYFKSMSELSKSLALNDLSMGMSADYIEAIKQGSTYVRVGSSIFGSRL